jgi:hypothetical protein
LRIYSDQEYRSGAKLWIDLFFPGAVPVTIHAEVMWVKALGKGAPARFDVGLAFVELKPETLHILRSLLAATEQTERTSESRVVERTRVEEPFSEEPVSETRPTAVRSASTRPAPVTSILPRVPVVLVQPDRLRATKLDGRAGFLVSLIDGATTVESLLDVSGMSHVETLALLEDLRRRGIVALH